jgi:hypothetical protein
MNAARQGGNPETSLTPKRTRLPHLRLRLSPRCACLCGSAARPRLKPFDEEPAQPEALWSGFAARFRKLTKSVQTVGRNGDPPALAVVSLARERLG